MPRIPAAGLDQISFVDAITEERLSAANCLWAVERQQIRPKTQRVRKVKTITYFSFKEIATTSNR
jgi:hypothetical protein